MPRKTQNVSVEINVTPPHQRTFILVGALAVISIAGCIGLSMLASSAQKATNATQTQGAQYATQTEAAWKNEYVVAPTQTAYSEAATHIAVSNNLVNQIEITDVATRTEGQIMPNGSSMAYGIQPKKVSFIQFTLKNNTGLEIGATLAGCFPTGSNGSYWPTNAFFAQYQKFEPGYNESLTCFLDWGNADWFSQTTKVKPKDYCFKVKIWDDQSDSGTICPYDYKN